MSDIVIDEDIPLAKKLRGPTFIADPTASPMGEFLHSVKVPPTTFAELVGTSHGTVYRWLRGKPVSRKYQGSVRFALAHLMSLRDAGTIESMTPKEIIEAANQPTV